jgi:Aspartyl protease
MTRMRGSCPRDPIRCPRTLAAKGGAELLDQPLLVLPLPRFVTDRGNRPALAGVVGYELLARFAVRTDYDHRMLTLTPAPDFHYQAGGKRVPLVFVNKHPVVSAAVDGIAGKFEIDTGSSAALVLQRKFVEQHGLEARHPGGLRMKSGGIDGVFETVITRVDRFGIADAEIARPAAEFPEEGRSGTPLDRGGRQLASDCPRKRKRPSRKMRLRWANSISTRLRSRRDCSNASVLASARATSRASS